MVKKKVVLLLSKLRRGREQKEMLDLKCPNCQGKQRHEPIQLYCGPKDRFVGIVQCLACNHEFPITMHSGSVQKLDTALPVTRSDKLVAGVSPDLKEDIREAERAHYHQCYKACVTMCRRALQLGLMDRDVEDGPLGGMLKEAHRKDVLTNDTYNMATSIKGYGDIGAHRRETLDPEEVRMVIVMGVRMLNELFKV